MNSQEVLRVAGLIVACGLVAAPLAALLRVPIMILLVGLGALVGPSALGWVESPLPSVGTQLIFTFGVSLILFHGGTGVSLRVISRTAVGLGMLVLPGVLITTTIVALVVMPVFGVSLAVALMIGAILSATDPAILIPLFDRLRLRPKVSQTVIAESAFNDPTATVLALTLAGVVTAGNLELTETVLEFCKELAIGAVFGIVGGAVLALMLSDRRLGIWRDSPAAAVLALVALEYFVVDEIGGSAYLAAFVMGLILGNMDYLGLGQHDHQARLTEGFIGQVSELATLAVFVVLGINLPFDALNEYFWGGLAVMAVFVFIARPITVYACLGPDRRGRWTREEILFVCWCRETGVVPAAVAGLLLSRGIEGADIAVALVAMAIVVTLLLQATTAGMLARRLGLVDEPAGA